ncbi:MAG TPA: hypothetical protein VFE63_09075, partial [Roseiarcus sp.]|nr:hypothetical protein [Roseiarcus sp.]
MKLPCSLGVDLHSDMLLVRADVALAQLARDAQRDKSVGRPPSPVELAPPRRPRRFYAKVALDPNRPTPQVSNIAQSILAELDRVRGTKITLTLDIDAETSSGFPEDVESV